MTSSGRPARFGVGKVLISFVAAETAAGPFWADWNETHIHNPNWPPPAKFHTGQTMSLGVGLSLLTFWALWRGQATRDSARQAVNVASIAASLYWLTNTSALAYPGAGSVDPPGTEKFPQWKFVVPSIALVAIGNVLERRRLRG